MAISLVGSASAAAASVTMPGGILAGDVIIIFAYNGSSNTLPTLPSGYTAISAQSDGTNFVAFRSGFKIAVGSDTSGTWTNATAIAVAVYRGASTVGGASSSINAGTGSTTDTITGIGTMQVTNGTSWAVSYSGSLQQVSMSTPSGTTLRKSQIDSLNSMLILVDSNAGVSSWGAHTSTLGQASNSLGGSVEIKAATGSGTPTNLFFF